MVAYPVPPVTLPLLLEQQAATPVAGSALTALGHALLTWTAPADGNLHRALLMSGKQVTSAETGGAVTFRVQSPGDASTVAYTVFAGGAAAGDYAGTVYFLPVLAGSLVTVVQATALTVGASTVWAEIWGA